MNALYDFLGDVTTLIVYIGAGALGVWLFWKLTVYRHDLILKSIKGKGGKIVSKEWHTRSVGVDRSDSETYYTIKYYDRHKKLHRAQVFVNEMAGEVIFEEDEII